MQFMFLSLIFHSIFFLFINVNYEKEISQPSSSVKVEYLEIKSNEAKKNQKKITPTIAAFSAKRGILLQFSANARRLIAA